MSEVWCTVQQPILFPPIYMMERFARCHHVVVLDAAQFDRDNTQFQLMTDGGPLMQSIALVGASFGKAFSERQVLRPDTWARKLRTTMQMVYGKRGAYQALQGWFHALLAEMEEQPRLDLFCPLSVRAVADLLGMETKFHTGSVLVPKRPWGPTSWLVEFCKSLGATDYVQGEKSMRSYFVKGPFELAGVRTWGQDFAVSYPSRADRTGHAGMSILDLLFTHGPETAAQMIAVAQGPGNTANSMTLITR